MYNNVVNNEYIINLYCNKYKFSYELMGNSIKIKSSRDTWYIDNIEFKIGKKIKLRHQNIKGSGSWHYQGTFYNFTDMFEYIHNHDNKEFYGFNKMFRITELLKQIKGGATV